MDKPSQSVYEFDSFRVDPVNRRLLCKDKPVALTPLAFNTLIFFIENAGRLITKGELLSVLWPGTFVDDSNVAYMISVVRKVLGDSGHTQKYIETVAKSGYRFTADLRMLSPLESRRVLPSAPLSVLARMPLVGHRGLLRTVTLGLLASAIIGSLLWIAAGRRTLEHRPRDTSPVLRDGKSKSTSLATMWPELTGEHRNAVSVWYLKGRYSWSRGTENGLKQSIVFFTNAINEDPRNALAYAGLADAYESLATWSVQSWDVAYRNAKAAAQRALELDNSLSQAHSALGNIAMVYDWNFPLAEREFRRAVELGPNDPIAHNRLGNYFASTGDFPDALREVRMARDLDPMSFDIGDTIGSVLFFSRRYDEAVAEFRKLVDLDPHYSVAHYRLGAIYFVQGDFKRAIPELEESSSLVNNREPLALGLYAAALARNGDQAKANAILDNLLDRARKEYISPTGVALLYMALGEEDEALKWIDKMFQDHIVTAAFAGVNPLFDSLRSNRRFIAHLKEVNAKPSSSIGQIFHLASR